jgi:hypothetical protein
MIPKCHFGVWINDPKVSPLEYGSMIPKCRFGVWINDPKVSLLLTRLLTDCFISENLKRFGGSSKVWVIKFEPHAHARDRDRDRDAGFIHFTQEPPPDYAMVTADKRHITTTIMMNPPATCIPPGTKKSSRGKLEL